MKVLRTPELQALSQESRVIIPVCVRPDGRDAFTDQQFKVLLDYLSGTKLEVPGGLGVENYSVLLVPADEYSRAEQENHLQNWARRHRGTYDAYSERISTIHAWRAQHQVAWHYYHGVLKDILSLGDTPRLEKHSSPPDELFSFAASLKQALEEDAESAVQFAGGKKAGRTVDGARAHILKELVDILCFWAQGAAICYNHNMKSVRIMEAHAHLLRVSSRKPGEAFAGQPFFAQISFVESKLLLDPKAALTNVTTLVTAGEHGPARNYVDVLVKIEQVDQPAEVASHSRQLTQLPEDAEADDLLLLQAPLPSLQAPLPSSAGFFSSVTGQRGSRARSTSVLEINSALNQGTQGTSMLPSLYFGVMSAVSQCCASLLSPKRIAPSSAQPIMTAAYRPTSVICEDNRFFQKTSSYSSQQKQHSFFRKTGAACA
jgi:hypothetical protein